MKMTQLDFLVLIDALRASLRVLTTSEWCYAYNRADRETVLKRLSTELQNSPLEIIEG